MLFGKSTLSIENVLRALWVLVAFHLLWIENDYEFDIAFDHEIMHKYLVYSFCLFYSHVQLHSSTVIFYQKGKSK